MHAALAAALVLALTGGDDGGEIERVGKLELAGKLVHADQLSGLALYRNLLVACPDEGARLNVLAETADGDFEALPPVALLEDSDAEIDMEGLAVDGDALYVVGSHSLARKKLDPRAPYEKNRQRLAEIKAEDSRRVLFRVTLDRRGRAVAMDRLSLKSLLEADAVLAPFVSLPSKENGIDIEGIAAHDGRLYLGFRGPVLRDNFVPVMTFTFDTPADYELCYVDLGGRGIRDLAAYSRGLVVLAGPVGDGDGSYELSTWNKLDCLPGEGAPRGRLTHLGRLKAGRTWKPEGIAVLEEQPESLLLLVVSDGQDRATVERIRVRLPH